MASIIKRGKNVSIVYYCKDEFGKRYQKWVKVEPGEDPKVKKLEVELELEREEHILPQNITVKEFLLKFAEAQASYKWAFNTYSGNITLMENHIFPYIGDMVLQKVRPYHIEKLYQILRKKPVTGPKSYNKDEKDIPLLSSTTIRHVHVLLNSAFEKAIQWRFVKESPVICEAPKRAKTEKAIWSSAETNEALRIMEKQGDKFMHAAVHAAFACTLRNGETVAIMKDCIEFDKHRIKIEKTLQRVNRKAFNDMPKDEVFFVFPDKVKDSNSVLILKTPKTDSSTRYIFMTPQLEEELVQLMLYNDRMKKALGDEYHDYGLVFCLDNGDPVEPKLMEKRFKKWQKRNTPHLPEIEFHGLRHSSVTYKLIVSEGDVKAVQGDSGHASAQMVTDTYSHIQVERQHQLTSKFGQDFYGEAKKENSEEKPEKDTSDNFLSLLASQFKKNPEILQDFLNAVQSAN